MGVGGKVVFRAHALRRTAERGIDPDDVRYVIEHGEAIEVYPDDKPYPSRLVLGWPGGRPLHALIADNEAEGECIIVTVYEPDPAKWLPGFRRRRP